MSETRVFEAGLGAAELTALAPLMILGTTIILLLLLVAWQRHGRGTALLAAIGLVATAAATPWASSAGSPTAGPLLATDGLYHLLTALLALATLAVVVFVRDRAERSAEAARDDERGEIYVLLLLGTLGAAFLAGAVHVASFFLGLELLSVSLYGLVALPRTPSTLEASYKYVILAAVSSAFFLLGAAFLYAVHGTLRLQELVNLAPLDSPDATFAIAGLLLVFVAIGFKLALVPFHFWTPEIYQGAPAPVTAYVATVSKAAVFAALLRLDLPLLEGQGPVFAALALVALASMLAGNVLALLEDDLKRLLAFSSIAHLGYLMVAVLAGSGDDARSAGLYYLVAYVLTLLTAFGVVGALGEPDEDAAPIERYRGLLWNRPWPAVALMVSLLSLAGIPLTAGFFGKLFVLGAGVGAGRWVLVLTLALTSVIGLFYYLRVVVVMIGRDGVGSLPGVRPVVAVVLAVLVGLIVVFGVYPPWLMGLLLV